MGSLLKPLSSIKSFHYLLVVWTLSVGTLLGQTSITLITPDTLPADEGGAITLRGRGFTGVTRVDIGSVQATGLTVVSDASLRFTVPALTQCQDQGDKDVVLFKTRLGEVARLNDGLSLSWPIDLQSIDPESVSTSGGDVINLQGEGFVAATEVLIDGIPVDRSDITFISCEHLRIVAPPHEETERPLAITVRKENGSESDTLRDALHYLDPEPTYGFDRFTPTEGEPGQLMALVGMGFEALSHIIFTSLTDEVVIVSDFNVQSDARLTFNLPDMNSGSYEIKLLWEVDGEDDVEIVHADPFIVPAPEFSFISFNPEEGEEGSTVEVLGAGLEYVERVVFSQDDEVQTEIVALELSGDHRTLQFVLPDLLPGEYEISLDFVVPGVTTRTITHREPFTVLVPPEPILVSNFSPTSTLYQGGEEFVILGQGFEPANMIRVQFGNETLILGAGLTLVEPGQIRGRFPHFANAPTSVTPDVLRTIDGELETVPSPDVVNVVGPLEITSVVQSPDPFPTGPGGGQEVTIEGVAFRGSCRVFIGGQEMINLALLPNGSLQGRAPDLAAGQYDLVVRDQAIDGTNLFVEALNQITYEAVPAPRVTRIQPYFLTINGRTEIQIEGENFTPTTRIFFQGAGRNAPLVNVDFEFQSSALLTAMAPIHAVGPVNAIAENTTGQTTMPEAAEYVSPFTPAPQQVYGTLVNQKVEFSWVNPIEYQMIHMYRNGEYVETLSGDATAFQDPAQITESSAHYTMVGELLDGSCSLLSFDILTLICDPPSDHGTADRGPKDFSLLGTHDPYEPPEEGQGGGGALGFADSTISASNDINHFPLVMQATRASKPQFNKFGSYNYLILRPNQLVSGFTLLKESTKLRIELHGTKLIPAVDLSLRVLIQSVTDGVERVVELEMPDVSAKVEHDWMELTYNTENPPPAPGEPLPEPGDPPLPAHAPLPPADYLVTIYAVGGELSPHYMISSDASVDQILVPEVRCPPYPLIRVTDTTGRNSNPLITGIAQDGDSQEFFPIEDPNNIGVLNPTIFAQMVVDVFDPDGDPIQEYEWEIKTALTGTDSGDIYTTAGNKLTYLFPSYGYYLVRVTARDQRCGESSRSFVVKIRPPCVSPPAGQSANFTYPIPQPNRLHLITNLPGNLDKYNNVIPLSFDCFVVDSNGCEGAAETNSVEFALFTEAEANSPNGNPLTLLNGLPAKVTGCILGVDPVTGEEFTECDLANPDPTKVINDPFGGRFWRGKFNDIRHLPPLAGGMEGAYVLMARASKTPGYFQNTPSSIQNWNNGGWGPWTKVKVFKEGENGAQATEDSANINVYNKPAFLDDVQAYTTGSFEPSDRSFHFTVAQSAPGIGGATFPDTEPQQLSVLGNEIPFPSLSNSVGRANQTSFVSFKDGFWSLDSHKGGINTTTLSGKIQGDKELLSGSGNGGGGSTFDTENLEYEYCERRVLFKDSFNTMLFNAILYSGFVGPVHVTISASVSLGVQVSLESQLEYAIRAFPDPGEEVFEADFWLLPEATVSLAAGIRADIFFGIASVEAGLNLALTFGMPFNIHVDSNGLTSGGALLIDLDIDFYYEICVALICGGGSADIHEDHFEKTFGQGVNTNTVPQSCSTKELILEHINKKRTQKGLDPVDLKERASQLDIASSPDGEFQVAVGVFTGFFLVQGEDFPIPVLWDRNPGYLLRQAGQPWIWQPRAISATGEIDEYELMDPKIIFLDNETVLFSGTRFLDGEEIFEDDDELTQFNKNLSKAEIITRVGHITEPTEEQPIRRIIWQPEVRVTEDQGPDGYRGDGRPDMVFAPGENFDVAWIAWVHYETQDVVVPLDPPIIQPEPLEPKTNIVQLNQTNIYAQRIFNGQPFGPKYLVSGVDNFIDIQVNLTVDQNGNVAMVWLRDEINVDLTTSNLGRNIMFSKFENGAWSTPEALISVPEDYPGLMEPSLALEDFNTGMVAFTALPLDADLNDTGLGNTRVVYTIKLLNGMWEEPVLIYNECNTPLFARWPNVHFNPPVDGPSKKDQIIPDYTIYVNELDAIGSPGGAGNVSLVTYNSASDTFGEVVQLTNDNRTHQDIAAVMTTQGELVVIHSSPEVANEQVGGAGGGLAEGGPNTLFETNMMSFEGKAVADPAISYCRLSDPYAGPGVGITAEVGVKNNGFARTPGDGEGMSDLFLRFTYVYEDRDPEQVAQLQVPSLDPGDELFLTAELIIPKEPVRIHVQIDGVDGELSVDNNLRDCPLGAQPPKNVTCELLENGDGWSVKVSWENAGLYNRVCIYRDGFLLTELPGSTTNYLDTGAITYDLQPYEGDFKYSVRGKLRHTVSIPTECEIFVPPIRDTEPQVFRRGDVDGNGTVEITDVVNNLSYQFLGSYQPSCLDACDFDDNGKVEITDPVGNLSYQFLGMSPPAEPGPRDCGPDPTEDDLEECVGHCEA